MRFFDDEAEGPIGGSDDETEESSSSYESSFIDNEEYEYEYPDESSQEAELISVAKIPTVQAVLENSKKSKGRPKGSLNKNNDNNNNSNAVSPDRVATNKGKISNKKDTLPVGWSQFPINLFSLTITKKKEDVPSTLLTALNHWSVECCIKGAFSTEVGSRAFKLHIQGVFECHYPKTPEYVKVLGIYLN
jgi:hypothetical protein